MSKLLIYIGANKGYGLTGILYREKFDRVIAFEPDTEMYKLLEENISSGRLSQIRNQGVDFQTVNAACFIENEMKELYIFDNRVSTSLGDAHYESDKHAVVDKIQVRTVNLYEFLQLNEINYIDCLLTDCQGSDLEIIKTIKPMIDEKKVGKILCETHRDDFNPYEGLSNSFSDFKNILSDNYEINYFSCDGTIKEASNVPIEKEWDTCWIKKQ